MNFSDLLHPQHIPFIAPYQMSPQTTMPKPNHQNKQSQNKEGELKGQIEREFDRKQHQSIISISIYHMEPEFSPCDFVFNFSIPSWEPNALSMFYLSVGTRKINFNDLLLLRRPQRS